jgi:hypothetical protein
MRRVVVDVRPGALGFDTDARLTRAQYAEMRSLGFEFAERYLGDLTTEEVDDCLGAGLLLQPLQHAHLAGWLPSEGFGLADGERAVRDAQRAEIPPMPLFADLEEPLAGTTTVEVFAHCRGLCPPMVQAGYEAGVYWGAGMPGDGRFLYSLPFTRYWKSFSDVVTPWRRGWQLVQLYSFPLGQVLVREVFPQASDLVGGRLIDLDVAQSDYLGSRPRMLAGVP